MARSCCCSCVLKLQAEFKRLAEQNERLTPELLRPQCLGRTLQMTTDVRQLTMHIKQLKVTNTNVFFLNCLPFMSLIANSSSSSSLF